MSSKMSNSTMPQIIPEQKTYDNLEEKYQNTSIRNSATKYVNHYETVGVQSALPPCITQNISTDTWIKKNLVWMIILSVFTLAAFCMSLAALIQVSTSASKEMQKLITRTNELEKLVEICNVRSDELEEVVESNNANLNSSIQETDKTVNKLENKTAQLEETIMKLHSIFILNGTGYMLTTEAKNWNESRRKCQLQGGDLAAAGIRDLTSRRYIGEALLKQVTHAWIGLTDEFMENKFVWVDEVQYTEGNPSWTSGEPNDYGHDTNCVEINQNLTMNDDFCNIKYINYHGICEINLLA